VIVKTNEPEKRKGVNRLRADSFYVEMRSQNEAHRLQIFKRAADNLTEQSRTSPTIVEKIRKREGIFTKSGNLTKRFK
jgi:hypothetical protein